MAKARDRSAEPDQYDFSKGVRGKYAKRYAQGTNVVVIDPDVRDVFPDSESVNKVLRPLAEIIRSGRVPSRAR